MQDLRAKAGSQLLIPTSTEIAAAPMTLLSCQRALEAIKLFSEVLDLGFKVKADNTLTKERFMIQRKSNRIFDIQY
jgi:hypothetical protein